MKWGYILQVHGRSKERRLTERGPEYYITDTVIGFTIQSYYDRLNDKTVYATAELAWKAPDATGHKRLPGITNE